MKKNRSIQYNLIKYFIVAVAVIVFFSIVGFSLLIDNETLNHVVHVSAENEEEISQVRSILRSGVIILFLNTVIMSIVVTLITGKTVLNPLKTITDATQRVAKGDFSIELETMRNDEVGELTRNFNSMVKNLNNIEDLQNDFIDNVSHEIKTPISSIQGFAKMLEKDNLSEEKRKEYSEIIIEESNRLLNLSSNMLKLSKLQHQDRILNKEPINIAEQIRKTIALLEKKWSEKGIIFNIDMDEKYFIGNEELLFQVWTNLIDNSIKFSNASGHIDISLKELDNTIVVRIRDYGKGMKKEEVSKIFNRFYQIDRSHSGEGYGLGLPITKRIVELSDGILEVESKVGEGTTMVVKLPSNKMHNKVVVE